MTIRELLEVVDRKKDGDPVRAAAAVVDFCRLKLGMTYDQIFTIVLSVIPDMTLARWDALLYEADWEGP